MLMLAGSLTHGRESRAGRTASLLQLFNNLCVQSLTGQGRRGLKTVTPKPSYELSTLIWQGVFWYHHFGVWGNYMSKVFNIFCQFVNQTTLSVRPYKSQQTKWGWRINRGIHRELMSFLEEKLSVMNMTRTWSSHWIEVLSLCTFILHAERRFRTTVRGSFHSSVSSPAVSAFKQTAP